MNARMHARLSTAVYAVLILLILSPVLALFYQYGSFSTLIASAGDTPFSLLFDTLLFASVTVIIAVILGLGCAFALSRLDLRTPWRLILIMMTPLFIPTYIYGFSWSRITSKGGLIYETTDSLGVPLSGPFLTGWWGAVVSLATSFFPVVFLLTYLALRKWRSVSHPNSLVYFTPLRLILMELNYLRTPIAIAAIVVFVLTIANFSVPDLFTIRVYATDIFIQMSALLNIDAAIYRSFPVVLTIIIILLFVLRLYKSRPYNLLAKSAEQSGCCQSFKTRLLTFIILSILLIIILGLPIGNLIFLIHTHEVILQALDMIKGDLLVSTVFATIVSIMVVAVGLYFAYCARHSENITSTIFRVVLVLMFVFPGGLLAIGMTLLLNQEGWAGWLYSVGGALVMANFLHWLAVSHELLLMGWRQISVSQEHAAYASGLDSGWTLRKILLPQMQWYIFGVFLISFVFVFNEITMAVLLSPPGMSLLPLRIFSTVHYGPDQLLAAVCLLQVAFIYLILIVYNFFGAKPFPVSAEVK